MADLGGSEIYTYTLVEALIALGYEVDLMTFRQGQVSRKVTDLLSDCAVIDLATLPDKKYDVALLSHHTCFLLPIHATVKVQICHGKYPSLEQPTFLADGHVAISQEVSDHLGALGFPSIVIPNPINLDRFKPTTPPQPNLRKILSLCQGETANLLLEKCCKANGWELECLNKFGTSRWDIEHAINDSDLVVSLGRGVIESMACARPVVVFDARPYAEPLMDGMITDENREELARHNFSGRSRKIIPSQDLLTAEIRKYDSAMGEANRSYVVRTHGASSIASQLVQLAEGSSTNRMEQSYLAEIFRRYHNHVLFSGDEAYFVRHFLKMPLSDLRQIKKIANRFGLSTVPVYRDDAKYLDKIPWAEFATLSASQKKLNQFQHQRAKYLHKNS